jgi:hypothetical protein
MKHVRVVIDEIVWFDGIPEEINVSQTEDTLILKIGPRAQRRGGSSLGDLLASRRETPPPRPISDYVPPVMHEGARGTGGDGGAGGMG